MGAIIANTRAGKKLASEVEFIAAKADAALVQIDADLVLLDGAPSNADVIAIVRRTLVRQRKLIVFIASMID